MTRYFLVALVSILFVVGCAKKRPLPQVQRGEFAGTVQVTPQLQKKLRGDFKLADTGYCFQALQSEAGTVTLELSSGKCPKDGPAPSALVATEIWGNPTDALPDGTPGALLLAGQATSPMDKTPVGIVTTADRRRADGSTIRIYTVTDFCTGGTRFDLINNCSIVADKKGTATKFQYLRTATVAMQMLKLDFIKLRTAEDIRREMTRIDGDLVGLIELADLTRGRLEDFESKHGSIGEELKALEARTTLLSDRVAALQRRDEVELTPFSDRLTELETQANRLLGKVFDAELTALTVRLSELEEQQGRLFDPANRAKLADTETRAEVLRAKITHILDDAIRIQLEERAKVIEPLKDKVDFLLAQETSTKLKSLEDRVADVTPKLAALEDAARLQQLGTLENQVADIETVLVRLLDAAKLDQVADLETRTTALRTQVDFLLSQATSQSLKAIEDRVADVTPKLKTLEEADRLKKLQDLQKQVESVEAILGRILHADKNAEIDALETRAEALETTIDGLLSTEYQRKVEDTIAKISEAKRELESIDRDAEASTERVTELREMYEALNRDVLELVTGPLSAEITRVEHSIAELEKGIDRYSAEQLTELLRNLKDSRVDLSGTEIAAVDGNVQENIQALQDRKEKAEKALADIHTRYLDRALTVMEQALEQAKQNPASARSRRNVGRVWNFVSLMLENPRLLTEEERKRALAIAGQLFGAPFVFAQ